MGGGIILPASLVLYRWFQCNSCGRTFPAAPETGQNATIPLNKVAILIGFGRKSQPSIIDKEASAPFTISSRERTCLPGRNSSSVVAESATMKTSSLTTETGYGFCCFFIGGRLVSRRRRRADVTVLPKGLSCRKPIVL
jgi:hypothetical protein